MILRSLKATHFKKFRELELADLPPKGLIGIVGPNEAGKSTVVDAITFALFAKTETERDETDLTNLIHWDEDVCQVELEFELDGGRRYRLFREIDRMGDHLAQLQQLGAPRAEAQGIVPEASRLFAGDEPPPGAVSGPLRVARELKRLLGYNFQDFRHSFFLAQHGAEALGPATQAPDWSGVLFRMTGIATMDRAIDKAEAVAGSIRDEMRQLEGELGVQERLMAAMGVTAADERGLVEAVGHIQEEIQATEASLDGLKRRRQDALERVHVRAQSNRELGGLATAVLEEQLAGEVTGLAAGLEVRRTKLEKERAREEGTRDGVRGKHERVAGLRRLVEELDARLGERRAQLDARLNPQSPDSLVDAKDAITRNLKRLRGRGRASIGWGIFLMLLGAVACAWWQWGQALVPVTLPEPFLPIHVLWAGTALLGLGLMTAAMGARRRSVAQQLVAASTERLSELDAEIGQLMSEREVLSGNVLQVVRDGRAARIQDERALTIVGALHEDHREFIERSVSVDEYAAQLSAETQAADDKLRQIDVAAERLGHLSTSVKGYAQELAILVDEPPAPLPIDSVSLGALEEKFAQYKQRVASLSRRLNNDRRPLAARLDKLHEQLDRFGADPGSRLRDLESLLKSPARHESGAERHLVGKVDNLLKVLPGEGALREEVTRLGGAAEEMERKLAEERTRLTERRAEMERMRPQFEKRQTVEDEIGALKTSLADLQAQSERELQAARLLRGAADQLRSRLAPAIGRSLGKRLSRITGGRYSRVSVDLDFGIHIYSDDRNAFVRPADLSGGTHDQLMLALRLAFAEVLLATRGRAQSLHLLLLDEPMDGFDMERTQRFLTLLREHDGPLQQVVLLANKPELGERCDLTFRTDVATERLAASGLGEPLGIGTATAVPAAPIQPDVHGSEPQASEQARGGP